MKKISSLLYFLFSFALAIAQVNHGGKFGILNYVSVPDRPALGSNATLTYSAPGNILNNTGGTTDDKLLSGTWTEFHAFSFTGTSGAYRRISNLNGSTVIGSVANHLFTREGTGSTFFEINGKSVTEPLYFLDVGSVAATSAIQMSAFATGPHVRLLNLVNNSRGYAVFANTSGTLSGGNSTTPTTSANNYEDFSVRFVRSFNATGNKEHFYFGATTTNTYAIHKNLFLEHLLGYQATWDGIQILNATNFTLQKSTFVTSGTANTGGQNASLQVQNAYGIVRDCIFTDAPQGLRFSTHNLLFQNNYVQWTGNIANEILSYYGNYASTNRLMVDPIVTEILIENCDFVSTTWTGAAFNVLDPNVNVTIRNCRFSGPTSLFQDSRGGGPTGVLTDGGGNTFGATIPAPTFTNFTPTDFTRHGLLTQITHYNLRRGYRTP